MADFTPGQTGWETVQEDRWTTVERMPVPSGWLYKLSTSDDLLLTFVPAPAAVADASGGADVALEEARDHLGAALKQSVPSDDQIIVGHIKSAHSLLVAALRARRQP